MPAAEVLHDILREPETDDLRLKYAVLLEQAGNPRGEFIRLQCALASGAGEPTARQELEARQQALLLAHREEWEAAWWGRGVTCHYRRGFIETALFDNFEQFFEVGERLFSVEPVRTLHVAQPEGPLTRFAESALVERLSAVRLGVTECVVPELIEAEYGGLSGLEEEDVRVLASSNHLRHLHTLAIRGCVERGAIGPKGMKYIAESSVFSNLRSLDLASNEIGAKGIKELVGSKHLQQLGELGLEDNNLTDAAIKSLASTPLLVSVRSLNLAGNRFGNAGAKALAQSPHLARLIKLQVAGNGGIGEPGRKALSAAFGNRSNMVLLGLPAPTGPAALAKQLAAEEEQAKNVIRATPGMVVQAAYRFNAGKNSSMFMCSDVKDLSQILPHLRRFRDVRELSVFGTAISDDDMAVITDLKNLRTLDLFAGRITDKGAALLADHVHLRELDLRNSEITDAGLAHLSGLTNLTVLCLVGNPITDTGLVHLANLKEITSLGLCKTRITDSGLAHLHHMKKLSMLGLDDTGATESGFESLRRIIPSVQRHTFL